MTDDNRRFIIVGTGRSGSSLLAAILADAGANFDMPERKKWNRDGGAYEHPLLVKANNWYSRAEKFNNTGLIPFRIVKYCRRQTNLILRELFTHATFAKYPVTTRLVYEINNVGFKPVVIVSFRNFDSLAVSLWQRKGYFMTEMIDLYVNTYKTTLLQLRAYGGCVVDYADIVNPDATSWIDSLSSVTGIAAEKIAEARANRVKSVRRAEETPAFWDAMMQMDERPQQIFDILRSLSGQAIVAK